MRGYEQVVGWETIHSFGWITKFGQLSLNKFIEQFILPIWYYLPLFDVVNFGILVAVEPFTNNDEFDKIMDGKSLGNMDFWNLHKISFHLVYNMSRHQIDPLYAKTASYPMD